jgi:hypothetical protein
MLEEEQMRRSAYRLRAEASRAGMPVPGVRRKVCVSGATFFNWRKKCGRLEQSGLRSLEQLE